MQFVQLVLRRPMSVIMLILGIVVFGSASLSQMPLEYMPDMEMPMELEMVTWPGADADSGDRLPTQPLEEECDSLPGPDSITRGFVDVKEAEGLMDELRQVALDAILDVDTRYATDWSAIKQSIKGDLSNYLYKKTKRSPMILPVIMEV